MCGKADVLVVDTIAQASGIVLAVSLGLFVLDAVWSVLSLVLLLFVLGVGLNGLSLLLFELVFVDQAVMALA